MFGHPSATAAITNDIELVNGFNNDAQMLEPITNPVPPTQTDQAIAQRLASALFNSTNDIASAIAQVVIGQDASRATNEDNSQLQINKKAPLRFYHGDVVYVKITLANFSSTIGLPTATGNLAQQFVPNAPLPQDYNLRIRLTTGGL